MQRFPPLTNVKQTSSKIAPRRHRNFIIRPVPHRPMDRLDRIFQEAQNRAASEDGGPKRGLEAALARDGEDDASKRAAMSVADRVLADYERGDYFSCLGLPPPDCDDAGRPVWDVTDAAISKAYRRASLAVHPDKNPTPEAKAAFDKLNDAVRALRDDVRRGEALRTFADVAFKEKCRANPELMAKARKDQERRDAADYGAAIRAQQAQQLERAMARREKVHAAFRRRRGGDDDASSSDASTDGDSDDAAREVDAEKKKKKGEESGGGGVEAERGASSAAAVANGGGGDVKRRRFGVGGRRGGIRAAKEDSDEDDGGLARPVLGAKKKPRFIM